MDTAKSLGWWKSHGKYVLMATAYQDAVITDADGCHFTDTDGNRYLDLSAGQICSTVGHGHPDLLKRVTAQMSRTYHTGTSFLSPVVFEFSRRLADLTPGDLQRTLLLSTGAEANEYALRLAKAATGRTGVLALSRGYAGLSLATTSLSNFGKGARPLVPGSGFLLTPDPTQCPPGRAPLEWAAELLEHSLDLQRGQLDNVAAIIVEPILSAGGLIVLPDGYLTLLRKLADDLGALLIADEAQTGMGRTARWFGVDHEGVVPDILVLSKGLGGGFPLSAVTCTPEVAERAGREAGQFSSHQSDPLGAAAGLAVVDIIEREGLVEQAGRVGAYLLDGLRAIAARRPELANVRGKGLMVGFDVFRDPADPRPESDVGRAVEDFCRSRRVHFQAIQKNRFRILPPLTITAAHVDVFLAVLEEALEALSRGNARPDSPHNPETARFMAHARRRGLGKAARWVWTHSPSDWVTRLRSRAVNRPAP